jgi:hypothetical protein
VLLLTASNSKLWNRWGFDITNRSKLKVATSASASSKIARGDFYALAITVEVSVKEWTSRFKRLIATSARCKMRSTEWRKGKWWSGNRWEERERERGEAEGDD